MLMMMTLLHTPGAIALHKRAPGFVVGVLSFSCHG